MKLMDKFKNLFTDEEYEDEEEFEEPVKIKEIKKEEKKEKKDKLPTFMREKIEKEEKSKGKDDVPDFKINDSFDDDIKTVSSNIEKDNIELVEKSDNKFKFPIEFEESDFSEISRVSRQARNNKQFETDIVQKEKVIKKASQKELVKKEVKVAELYKDKKEEEIDIRKFRATPIISPIYGVLDKNYRKDEIETNSGNYEINRPSKSIDFDSVRKKAYGSNLEDEIKNNLMCENCDYFKSAKTCKKGLEDDDLVYEALCKKNKEDDITLDEATENYYDYGVEYEKTNDIDSYYDDDVSEDVKIVNHDDDIELDDSFESNDSKKGKGVPPVKSSINLLSTLKKSMEDENGEVEAESKEKNLELTDDLFNLIDSMYDEGNDE